MCKIPTLYSDYQECILDLDIYGKIVATPQQSMEDLTQALFEEFKRRKPLPTLEYKRYELSRLVSPDYRIAYNKELELQDNESLIELKNLQSSFEEINFEDLTPLIPEVREMFSYENNITDVVRQDIIKKYNLDTGKEFKPGIKQTEDIVGSVEEDSELNLSEESINTLGVDTNEEVLDINESYEPTEIVTEEPVEIEVEEDSVTYDTDEDADAFFGSYDEDSNGEESDDNFFEDSDKEYDGVMGESNEENLEGYDEDADAFFEGYEDSDESIEDSEFSEDSNANSFDDYDEESPEDTDFVDTDKSEDTNSEDSEDDADDFFDGYEEESEDNLSEDDADDFFDGYSEESIEKDLSDSDNTSFENYEDEDSFNDSVLEEPEFSNSPEPVINKQVGIPVTPAQVYNNVTHEEVVDRSAEPTDIRAFLRKHPRCDYEFALKYFTKKQINDAIKIGKIVKKGNILKI